MTDVLPGARACGVGCTLFADWWRLVGGEPYRLLFPVGTVLGIAGVMMWPLHVWGVLAVYPGPFHARVMIEGFLTCFVVGFLGTALPRLLGVPRFTRIEAAGFAAAIVALAWLHASGRTFWGDQVFFIVIATLVLLLGVRGFLFRRDTPPPGFVLVAGGLFSALAGAGILVISHVSAALVPAWLFVLGGLLLYQGYLVFPIMGIGAFLLPRFFGMPGRQNFPESCELPPGWLQGAGFALVCGGIVMAGFVAEAAGFPRWGNGLRAAGILVYFFREIPVHRAGFGGGSLAMGLRFALFSIPLAYVLMAFLPGERFALLHVLFISGFSLLTFIVASRVILGHSGQSDRFRATIRSVLVLTALIVLAMLTRVTADWMPQVRISHYAYAALAWIAGVAVWAACVLPGVLRPDSKV